MMVPRILAAGLALLAATAPSRAQTPLTTKLVAGGFNLPLYVTSPPGDHDRLFVVEQRGRIKIIKDGVVNGTPFLDLSAKVSGGGNERGLLGLAFHPNYDANGWFYVNYTQAVGHDTVVERYAVDPSNPDLGDPSSGVIVLGPINQPFSNHNGGCVQFGPDGTLYVGMGDGGSAGDPNCRAQKGTTLLGKLLRVNDDGSIPSDNPFVGDPTFLDEIWAYGLRNPWRFAFDRQTGDLYLADVGQNQIEEVDFQPASSGGGENYGWKIMEGTNCFGTGNCPPGTPPCNDPSLTMPIHTYTHASGCSITGGFVYRGCAIPDLQGTYFFADFCNATIWSFTYDGVAVSNFQDRTTELAPGGGLSINLVTSFGEDADGELYIVDQGGEIFQIVANAPPASVDLGFGKPGGNGLVPAFETCGLLDSSHSALFRLRDAPPSAPAALFFSTTQSPQAIFQGTLVPGPPLFAVPVTTDANGEVLFPVQGGGGPFTLFMQYLIADPGASAGVGFSNALQVNLQP